MRLENKRGYEDRRIEGQNTSSIDTFCISDAHETRPLGFPHTLVSLGHNIGGCLFDTVGFQDQRGGGRKKVTK